MHYFIANWKANKNLAEAWDWIDSLLQIPSRHDRIRIIICPPAHLIYPLKIKLNNNSKIKLGVQDLSSYEEGSHTGEITAKSLKGLVDYAIVGHSERRDQLNEDYEQLDRKSNLAIKYNIQPIFCLRSDRDLIPNGVKIIAYEPVSSIGTGQNEDPLKVIGFKHKLNLAQDHIFIYGGSVNSATASSYLNLIEIDGLLVGGASLDPGEFTKIVNSV